MEVRETDASVILESGVLAVHGEVSPLVACQQLLGAVDGHDVGEQSGDAVHEAVDVGEELGVRHRHRVGCRLVVVDLAVLIGLALHKDGLETVHRVLGGLARVTVSYNAGIDELTLCDHRDGDVIQHLRQDVVLDDVAGDRHIRHSLALLVEIEQPALEHIGRLDQHVQLVTAIRNPDRSELGRSLRSPFRCELL